MQQLRKSTILSLQQQVNKLKIQKLGHGAKRLLSFNYKILTKHSSATFFKKWAAIPFQCVLTGIYPTTVKYGLKKKKPDFKIFTKLKV